jgi:hypothetical protein
MNDQRYGGGALPRRFFLILEHDPKKRGTVLRKDHAQSKAGARPQFLRVLPQSLFFDAVLHSGRRISVMMIRRICTDRASNEPKGKRRWR